MLAGNRFNACCLCTLLSCAACSASEDPTPIPATARGEADVTPSPTAPARAADTVTSAPNDALPSSGGAANPNTGASQPLPPPLLGDDSILLEEAPVEVVDEDDCGRLTQLAELTAVNLVVLFDSSGSMGDNEATNVRNLERRWLPARAGVLGFLESPGAPGIYASLEFFPAPGGFDAACSPNNYASPDVPLRDVSDLAPFASALETRQPSGGTPMLPALMGAMEYARSLLERDPASKTVVVMVTDGEPAVIPEGGSTLEDVDPECPRGASYLNDVPGVAAFTGSMFEGEPSIPTYVIGIGDSVSALAQIATSGGTEMVFIADSDPGATQAAMSDALAGIRSHHFECQIEFPALPEGQSVGAVNVDFVRSSGAVLELVKATETCSDVGWTLDDETNPTKILLCPEACDVVQQDLAGRLELSIGCATRVQGAR